jgi:GntR family transcriptional regulator, trigonelline degradation regulator
MEEITLLSEKLQMTVAVLREVVPSPLRQQVVEILRNAITECVFEPGGRLIERELCEMLGVSRTTLREGLRQLEAEGLVRLEPNKGPTVPSLTAEEAGDVYAVRRELEGFACARCAERANKQDLAALAGSLDLMRRAMAKDDFKMLQHAKTEFFDRLYDAAANPELKRILQRLRARVTLIRGLDINRRARVKESVEGARAILTALTKRDSAAARRAGERHIDRAASLALDAARAAPAGRRLVSPNRPHLGP